MADEVKAQEVAAGDQPVTDQQQPQAEPQNEMQAVMAKLDSLGVREPAQLDGILTASQQAGRLANLLGAANKRIEDLERAMSQTRQPYQQPAQEGQGQAIDLRSELKSAVKDVLLNDFVEPQRRAEQQYWQEVNTIINSPHYPLVKDKWNFYIQHPTVQQRVRSGQSSIAKEFQELVLNEYREIALQTREALKKVGGVPGAGKPPHVESGTKAQPTIRAGDRDEQKEQILKKWTGTDQDIDKMVDLIFEKPR